MATLTFCSGYVRDYLLTGYSCQATCRASRTSPAQKYVNGNIHIRVSLKGKEADYITKQFSFSMLYAKLTSSVITAQVRYKTCKVSIISVFSNTQASSYCSEDDKLNTC